MNTFEKYPRQFLVSTTKAPGLENLWGEKSFNNYNIYHSPLLEFYSVEDKTKNNFALMFGYAYNSNFDSETEVEILSRLLKYEKYNDFNKIINQLGGRYVIFIHVNNNSFIYNDPSGLRTVYYTNSKKEQIFGTQPLIIGEATNLIAGEKIELFFHSKYFYNAVEYWMPCGLSIYQNISQLVPNHLLDLYNKTQKRYWPDKRINEIDLEEGVTKTSDDLLKAMGWANSRFDLILPLTAGYDSRSILAASKNIISDISTFTLKHKQRLTKKHPDLTVPRRLSKKLGFEHHIVYEKANITSKEEEIYKLNNSTSRFKEQNYIFMFNDKMYDNKVWVNGNVSEIAKTFYFANGKIDNIDDLLKLVPEWNNITFFKKHLEDWLKEAIIIEEQFNIDIRDLFYWEHRMGNWCARALNENGFRFEIFSPHNTRSTLINMLSVDKKYRSQPDYEFFISLIKRMWPEVLVYPFNPKTYREKFISLLKIMGLKSPIKRAIAVFK